MIKRGQRETKQAKNEKGGGKREIPFSVLPYAYPLLLSFPF